jgi:hypothetical protein
VGAREDALAAMGQGDGKLALLDTPGKGEHEAFGKTGAWKALSVFDVSLHGGSVFGVSI